MLVFYQTLSVTLDIATMRRKNISSGGPWEASIGYSRAVVCGAHVFVSGTTATNQAGEIVGGDDAAAQMRQCLENIQIALQQIGSDLHNVVRTRIYLVNIDDWQAVGSVHAEYFSAVKPAATMVAVTALINPEMLVEVEADAYIETH